jgi:hypothetical protein
MARSRTHPGKLILSEEELHEQVALLMKPSERRIAQLEKQLASANARRQQAQDELARLRKRLNSGAPQAEPFDSSLSLKALPPMLSAGGQRNQPKGDGAHSSGWEPPARARL